MSLLFYGFDGCVKVRRDGRVEDGRMDGEQVMRSKCGMGEDQVTDEHR